MLRTKCVSDVPAQAMHAGSAGGEDSQIRALLRVQNSRNGDAKVRHGSPEVCGIEKSASCLRTRPSRKLRFSGQSRPGGEPLSSAAIRATIAVANAREQHLQQLCLFTARDAIYADVAGELKPA